MANNKSMQMGTNLMSSAWACVGTRAAISTTKHVLRCRAPRRIQMQSYLMSKNEKENTRRCLVLKSLNESNVVT